MKWRSCGKTDSVGRSSSRAPSVAVILVSSLTDAECFGESGGVITGSELEPHNGQCICSRDEVFTKLRSQDPTLTSRLEQPFIGLRTQRKSSEWVTTRLRGFWRRSRKEFSEIGCVPRVLLFAFSFAQAKRKRFLARRAQFVRRQLHRTAKPSHTQLEERNAYDFAV